jgi:hypothetical protein
LEKKVVGKPGDFFASKFHESKACKAVRDLQKVRREGHFGLSKVSGAFSQNRIFAVGRQMETE